LKPVPESPLPETGRSRHLRVLVVEDDEINQMVAQGVVEALGYESDLALDGAAAVTMAAASSYDAIVMDLQMPHMDGYTASRLIRAAEIGAALRVPIIAMTASESEGERERCAAAGMDAYLTKPLEPTQLEDALWQHISGDTTDWVGDPPAADEPLLDMSRLDALGAMGDAGPPLVERIIAAFVTGAQQSLTAIQRAVETRSPTELARVAHRLGGSAANLGAIRVSGICRELERHARRGDIPGAGRLVASLANDLEETVLLLRGLTPRAGLR
jgi:CheY-like chemotaxis protein